MCRRITLQLSHKTKIKDTRMSEILTEPVTGPSAWTPAELAADDGWIYPLVRGH
jgi:hypothetical protein